MLVLLIIALVFLVVWVMYGRGAYIVYKYKKDEGVLIPPNTDKGQVMEALKSNLGYKDLKETFFDEEGNICIAGKYDTYIVRIEDGYVYMDDPLYTDINDEKNNALSFLQKLGRFRIRSRRKKDRDRVEEILCIRAYITKLFNHNAPVNAYKKYADMTRAQKYSKIISIVCIVLVAILCFTAITNGTNNQKVDSIKFAYFNDYSSEVSIGKALDDFFANPTWKTYTENGKEYVKFSGEFLYYEEPALAVITFEFMELDWFRVNNISINGDMLNEYEQDEFLTVIFESYEG